MDALAFLSRWSYYVNLLGLKIPIGLLFRASRARAAFVVLLFLWVPFLLYCHFSLLPRVQEAAHRVAIWHGLFAMWVTLPGLTVANVILSFVRISRVLKALFLGVLGVACFHVVVIPAIAHTWAGAALLQVLFFMFEDVPIFGWIWCLFHVVKVQKHIATQSKRENPFQPRNGDDDRVVIIGNGPSVMDGEALGSKIDDFSRVVRFNSYNTQNPQYTGSKLSYHFCNGRNFPTSKEVNFIMPLFNASLTHAIYLFMPHMEDAVDICANVTSPKVNAWVVDESDIHELRKKVNCRVWQIPTSGCVAIHAFLKQQTGVSLHGFDFFEGSKIHYFEESPTQLITSWLERFVTHDPSREKTWVESLLKERRVSFLGRPSPAESTSPTEECTSDEKKSDARKRPGLLQTILKDGVPSQFSL